MIATGGDDFVFAEEKDEEVAITINLIAGSLGSPAQHGAIDHNREMLAGEALTYIGVRQMELSMLVRADMLSMWGQQTEWSLIKAGVKTEECAIRVFGKNYEKTYVFGIRVDCTTNSKQSDSLELRYFEVEVGVAGMEGIFKSLGKTGKQLVMPSPGNGYVLSMRVDAIQGALDPYDPDWKRAFFHFARKHLISDLTVRINEEQREDAKKSLFSCITHIETEAIRAVKGGVYSSSARGVIVHSMIKQVIFDRLPLLTDTGPLVAPGIGMMVQLPNGKMDPNNKKIPLIVPTRVLWTMPALQLTSRIMTVSGGTFFCTPSALQLLEGDGISLAEGKKAKVAPTRRGTSGGASRKLGKAGRVAVEGGEDGEAEDPGYASGGTAASIVKRTKGLAGLGTSAYTGSGSGGPSGSKD
jgi:hypothetical protein